MNVNNTEVFLSDEKTYFEIMTESECAQNQMGTADALLQCLCCVQKFCARSAIPVAKTIPISHKETSLPICCTFSSKYLQCVPLPLTVLHPEWPLLCSHIPCGLKRFLWENHHRKYLVTAGIPVDNTKGLEISGGLFTFVFTNEYHMIRNSLSMYALFSEPLIRSLVALLLHPSTHPVRE